MVQFPVEGTVRLEQLQKVVGGKDMVVLLEETLILRQQHRSRETRALAGKMDGREVEASRLRQHHRSREAGAG